MPQLSVIIPVYNVENYLERCINSVLEQSFSDFELILVDDGSTDRSGEMCDILAKKDKRINVIHKENGGLSDARNKGLDVIKGQYVCFIDSDDWISGDAFECLIESLVKSKADLSVGNMVEIYEDGNIKSEYCPFSKETIIEGKDILKTFNKPNATNRVYRSCIFDNLRFPKGKLYEDAFIYHKILARVNRIVFIGKITYYYFVRLGSIMHMDYDVRFTDIIEAMHERALWLDSINQKDLANDNRLFVYSQYAVAIAHLNKNKYRQRLEQIEKIYNYNYIILMKDNRISFIQKVRLYLLRYFPVIHTQLFGKKMPINLS